MCGICFGLRASSTPSISSSTLDDTRPSSSPGDNSAATVEEQSEDRDELFSGPGHLEALWQTVVESVQSRGPDYDASLVKHAEVPGLSYKMRFHTSVLHMRGQEVTPQPFVGPNGDVFLFNGEIFDGLEVGTNENDGQKLFDLILQEGPENLFAAIRNIEGPYAFVYYQPSTSRVYFARDPLGRRSLVMHFPTPTSPAFFLSSCTAGGEIGLNEWQEVTCDAIHCIDLATLRLASLSTEADTGLTSYPRVSKSKGITVETLIYPFDPLLTTIPSPSQLFSFHPSLHEPVIPSELHALIQSFLTELEHSVRRRVLSIPFRQPPPHARVAILFSGGIDCSTIALLVDRVLPDGESIDLINVAFQNPRVLKAAKEQPEIHGRKQRRKDQYKKVSSNGVNEVAEEMAKVAVSEYDVPDRLTGRASWEELKKVKPRRKWNFVEVDVPYVEMQEERERVIELMRPAATVMDLSISIAFYFAARGRGTILNPEDGTRNPYTSDARVLLSGLGADELLGGYARHRRAYNKSPEGDWKLLIEELQMDLDRIWIRNLGRDDRIISAHGKEARYPFLAGNVVDFLTKTEVWLKMDMRFPEGMGDKLLLRLLAKELGLSGAAQLKKRAIHFGARTAKMDLTSGRDRGDALLS